MTPIGSLDHQQGLAARPRTATAPPSGYADGQALVNAGGPFDRFDAERGGHSVGFSH